jgi:oligo-1,6-glucosidase
MDCGQSKLPQINVEQARKDPNSIFHYYKKLIQLRKQYEVIVYGSYQLILEDHPEIYAYTRNLEDERLLVILNFFSGTPTFRLPQELTYRSRELLISNYPVDETEPIETFVLRPYEARVYRLVES